MSGFVMRRSWIIYFLGWSGGLGGCGFEVFRWGLVPCGLVLRKIFFGIVVGSMFSSWWVTLLYMFGPEMSRYGAGFA